MLKFSPAFIALVFFMAAGIAPATQAFQGRSDEIISSTTAGEMVVLLKSFGWEAEITTDNAGGPDAVQITFNGYTSWLRLKDCPDNAPSQCGSLMFFSNWDLGRDVTQADMVKLNKYNDVNVVGRTYFIDKNGPKGDQVGIDFVISIKGGVTRQHLIQEVEHWDDIIDKFVETFRSQD